MVMSALDQRRELFPLVLLNVVQFGSVGCPVDFFAGASDYQVLFAHGAGTVAVTGVFHVGSHLEFVLLFVPVELG